MSAWIVPDSPLLLAVTAVTHTSRHPGNKTDNTFAAQALELSGGGRLLGNVVDCSWSPVAASTDRERGNSTFVIFIHSMPFPNAYKCDKDAIGSTEIPVWPVGLLEWNQYPIVSKTNMFFRCVFFMLYSTFLWLQTAQSCSHSGRAQSLSCMTTDESCDLINWTRWPSIWLPGDETQHSTVLHL